MIDPVRADAIGILGSVIIVTAYFLATRGRLPADELAFNLANLAGGSLVMVSLVVRPNPAAIIIEVMFLLIAGQAIARILCKPPKARAHKR